MSYRDDMEKIIDEASSKFMDLGVRKAKGDILSIINLVPEKDQLTKIKEYLGVEE